MFFLSKIQSYFGGRDCWEAYFGKHLRVPHSLIYTFLTSGPLGLSYHCVARELDEVPEASSVLLLSAHAPGYFQRPDVWPFLQQLRCYATQRGMRFETKSGPWPVQHETVAVIEVSWNLHQFWATRKPPGAGILLTKKKREKSRFEDLFVFF